MEIIINFDDSDNTAVPQKAVITRSGSHLVVEIPNPDRRLRFRLGDIESVIRALDA